MPLGNLTSQFFANIYLNELDQFVKHKLKAKYYIRYVDDFAIIHHNRELLEQYKSKINCFLQSKLKIDLHPDKSKITLLGRRLNFLGFRVFYFYRLLKKQNINKMKKKYIDLKYRFRKGKINYDNLYDFMEGWIAYSNNADTYNLRKRFLQSFEKEFAGKMSMKEINRLSKEA